MGKSASWRRERIIATALRFAGYGYQHHHVPDWDPPSGWPWKETCMAQNGKGVDCSNFTAFVYNLGLGIKPTGNVKDQSVKLEIAGPEGRPIRLTKIDKPERYVDLAMTLRTGDLRSEEHTSELQSR